MYVRDAMKQSFVMVQAFWQVRKARQLVKLLNPTHMIVHRTEAGDYYYLYSFDEARSVLSSHPDETPVHRAFNLEGGQATPAMDGYAPLPSAPPRAVIIEEGEVKGFYDSAFSERRGGATRGIGFAPGPEPVTRSLMADFPEEVRLDDTCSLLVSLSDENAGGAGITLSLPPGSVVDVVVQAKRGFRLEGRGEGTIKVNDDGETLPLQFKLTATEEGPGRLRVLAFHQGQPLGALVLAPLVVSAGQETSEKRHSQDERIDVAVMDQPDLSLLILEDQSENRPSFTFKLSAVDSSLGLNFKSFGPITLQSDPSHYFEQFFGDIESMPLKTDQDRARAELHLAAKGAHLFETLVPPDLQALLWSLRDRIRSIQVQSEEPWIPWELCKIQGRENGRIIEGAFLCEAFAVTRWLLETPLKPTVALNKMALVVPSDSRLPFASVERDYMLGLGAGRNWGVNRISARFADLMKAFKEGAYDGWHFTGHGGFRNTDPNWSAMVLENEEQMIPEDLSGEVRNLGMAKPLVFLNACQMGRSGMSLTGIGGWAKKFLGAGAGAFIGAYWSIYDKAALDFAKAFYDSLLSGMTMGAAVQKARAKIKPLGDPTWLAYTVYAHPLARLA